MKRNCLTVLALLLACLLVLTACGRSNQQGNPPDDPVGGGTDVPGGSTGNQPGGSGSGEQPGGSGSGDPGGNTDPGDLIPAYTTVLGESAGVTYWMLTFEEAGPGEIRHHLCAGDMAAPTYQKLFETVGVMEYVEGSLEASGNSALYFTVRDEENGPATLYGYDLYGKEVRRVLAAPCSNMVVFAGGDLGHYGWILQEDYIMPVDLKTQMADMTMAISTMELSAFADVGGSFFADGQTASIKESEYGVLEITLTRGSTMTGYLYTCDTFTAVKLK